MSTNRILILVAVLILVLFGISLAMSRNQDNKSADPNSSGFAKLNFSRSDKFDLHALSVNGGTLSADGVWTIPQTLRDASLLVGTNESKWKVRSLRLVLKQGDSAKIEYQPSHEPNKPGAFIDKEAVTLKIDLKPPKTNQPPPAITILRHGGTVQLHRTDASLKPLVLKVE